MDRIEFEVKDAVGGVKVGIGWSKESESKGRIIVDYGQQFECTSIYALYGGDACWVLLLQY